MGTPHNHTGKFKLEWARALCTESTLLLEVGDELFYIILLASSWQSLQIQIPLKISNMEDSNAPHVLVLPFPAEGHIKPMFNLAKLLSKYGPFKIIFVHSHRNHARLQRFSDLSAFHTQYPNFHFASITDGLPPDHLRSGPNHFQVFSLQCRSVVAMEFRELFIDICRKTGQWQPPACIIADGFMSTIVMDVGEEFKVPVISFRTDSATCTWITFFLNKLTQDGVIPLQEGQYLVDIIFLVSKYSFKSYLRW